jgi:hypothetical protein
LQAKRVSNAKSILNDIISIAFCASNGFANSHFDSINQRLQTFAIRKEAAFGSDRLGAGMDSFGKLRPAASVQTLAYTAYRQLTIGGYGFEKGERVSNRIDRNFSCKSSISRRKING